VQVSVTPKALWYIESHLSSELSLDAVAEVARVSRFHLSRAFAASTGISLTGYMRARRLSEAAKALVKGAPDILSVALDAGYGSHEAFTRAFRQHFGVTPEQLPVAGTHRRHHTPGANQNESTSNYASRVAAPR
jgi:AraC family transcriptional regulator